MCENPLRRIALMGALDEPVKLSSSELAATLSVSPQTAGRRLQSLEKEGLIERSLVPDGQVVMITDRGTRVLLKEFDEYKRIFADDSHLVIQGKVVEGMGEGQYYMSLDGYQSQFEELLGFTPYPGTLNLKLDRGGVAARHVMEERGGLHLDGFESEERTFGGGTCYPVHVEGIRGAIVIPERSHYPEDIVEIVAPVRLRDALGIEDGEEVSAEVE